MDNSTTVAVGYSSNTSRIPNYSIAVGYCSTIKSQYNMTFGTDISISQDKRRIGILNFTDREFDPKMLQSGTLYIPNDSGVWVETTPSNFVNLCDLIIEFNELKEQVRELDEIVQDYYYTVGPGFRMAQEHFNQSVAEEDIVL